MRGRDRLQFRTKPEQKPATVVRGWGGGACPAKRSCRDQDQINPGERSPRLVLRVARRPAPATAFSYPPFSSRRATSGWAGQVREHSGAGRLGLSKCLEGGAADLYGTSTLIDRTPRCQIPKPSAEAGAAASFKADHEGKAVTCRAPYMQILDETADAVELHDSLPTPPQETTALR